MVSDESGERLKEEDMDEGESEVADEVEGS